MPETGTTDSDIQTAGGYFWPTSTAAAKKLEFKVKAKSSTGFSVVMPTIYNFEVVAPACSNNEGITGHKIGTSDYETDGGVVKRRYVD